MIRVVSMSGGKDSTATALVALERHSRDELRFVFADTGNEHEATYEYVYSYLPQALGVTIDVVRADFTDRIAARRMFIANDQRRRPMRHTNKAKRRILEVMHPTGVPFLDLCMWKGRFPSRRAQFCTQFLKVEPMVEYQLAIIDAGHSVESWQGVRADESANRASLAESEDRGGGLTVYRPILRWNVQDVFAKLRQHGVSPNPLYSQAMTRVGCMPCINASKAEIAAIAKRFPVHVARIDEWEGRVSRAAKRGAASFFPSPNDARGAARGRTIHSVIRWANTGRGGRQHSFDLEPEAPACASAYGLCE